MQVEARSSRSRRAVGFLAVLLGLVMVPGLVSAQTLAEVARREEARRKAAAATKGDVKTYTNKDLVGGEVKPAQATPPAAAAVPAAQPEVQPKTEPPPDPKKDEKYWRQRVTEAQSKLAQDQVLLAALDSRINALMTDFVNRDDPAQRAVIASDRQKAINEMNRVKQDIERLTKEIADIQEEARKAGVPPGWLR